MQEPAGEWQYPVTDGLGSVRGYLDPTGGVLSSAHYGEWGVPSAGIVGPAFTGEPRDANGLQHHRKRYYNPQIAVWTALDPWEGLYTRPMSLNGYSWVEGRVVNGVDPSGENMLMYACVEQHVRRHITDVCPPRWSLQEDYVGLHRNFLVQTCLHPCGVFYLDPISAWDTYRREGYRDEDSCRIGGVGPLGLIFRFDPSEYPDGCEGRTPEQCLMYHLNFLANTSTIQYLRSSMLLPYMVQMFGSFVAPNHWNPSGTPGDIKGHYLETYQDRCITFFGARYGFDLSGNLTFGYIGRVAGFSLDILQLGAGMAQIFDTGSSGGPLGDAPEDDVAVRMGSALYDRCALNCTQRDLAAILTEFREEYLNSLSEASACPNP